MSKGTRYTDEFKAKAVRLLTESRPSYSSETKAIAEAARDPGVSSETLRRWRNQSDASAAEQSEQSAQEAMAELKRLRAENAELRRAAQAVPGRGRPGAGDVPMGLMVELETPPRQPGLQDTRAGRNRVLYEPGDTSRLTIKAEQKPDQFSRHPLSSCLNDNDAHSGSYGPSFTTLLIHARACTMPPVNAVTYRTAALLSSLIEPLSSPVEFDSGGTADDTPRHIMPGNRHRQLGLAAPTRCRPPPLLPCGGMVGSGQHGPARRARRDEIHRGHTKVQGGRQRHGFRQFHHRTAQGSARGDR